MTNRRSYASRKKTSNVSVSWILFLASIIWLIASIATQKSPTAVLSDTYKTIVGDSSLTKSHNTWTKIVEEKDIDYNTLLEKLNKCQNATPFLKGIVDINDQFVNMRSDANIASKIITQVPNGAKVEVQYYDSKEYIYENKTGKWAKVQYADLEGWIWGNFITILNKDSQ